MEGFVRNDRTVFSLRYRLECPPPAVMELIVPLDRDGNALSPCAPLDKAKRIVQVRPGETLVHNGQEHKVIGVEVYR